ncbi:hypothetical protein RF11_07078 [Thelohanellus kitauei]|uniref:Uncharacterized protein n=1 Tax=Thelohanellus kitauei TaxID=669202 RepID=A0A0C2M567_THEKT|nr:hypothetical protein RF11_07078 [Thelohanellus kitauei]
MMKMVKRLLLRKRLNLILIFLIFVLLIQKRKPTTEHEVESLSNKDSMIKSEEENHYTGISPFNDTGLINSVGNIFKTSPYQTIKLWFNFLTKRMAHANQM